MTTKMDWARIGTNAAHISLFAASAYVTVDPRFVWAAPALVAIASVLPPAQFYFLKGLPGQYGRPPQGP